MAMIANKKKVNNKAGLIGLVKGIDKKDVVKCQDFGRFLVVILKDGAVYHSYSGFEVRSKAWSAGMVSDSKRASLYEWLVNLVNMKEACEEHGEEKYPETEMSYNDILDCMKIMTESNLTYPITAFTDIETASKFTNEYILWLGKKIKELDNAMNTEVKEETDDDLQKDYEHGQNAIKAEVASKVLNEINTGK